MTTPGQGWGNPVVGGTALRIPAIQSPNFVHGVSGWAIYQTGAAEFNSIVVPPGTSGNVIFTQATTPTALNTGDLWIDTASANAIFVWNGSAWVAYQFGTSAIASGSITAALIAANTITASQLAAGIIYAGIVDGTTITGSTLLINNSHGARILSVNKSAGTWLLYADLGTSSQGSLIASCAAASGTDEFSNAYPQGLNVTKGAISGTTFTGTNFVINTSGAFFYSGAPALGNLAASVVPGLSSGTDSHGNTYYPGVCSYAYSGTTLEGVVLIFSGNYLLGTPAQIAHYIAGSVGVTQPAALGLTSLGVGGEDIILSGGTSVSTNTNAAIELIEGTSSAAGTINLFASDVQIQDGATAVTAGVGHIRGFAAGQTISTAAFTTITGLSILLGARKYFFRARVFLNANTSAGQFQVEITAPAGTSATNYSFKWESGAGASALNVNRTTFSNALGGPAASVSGPYWVTIEGTTTLSAAGSLVVKGLDTGTPGTDTWTVYAGSYFEAFPVA